MERLNAPIGGAEQMIVCPNCGNRQVMAGVDSRCDRCGTLLDSTSSGTEAHSPIATTLAPSDPARVPPPMASGGLGGVNDGTQVSRHSPTAVPGKPMAPIEADRAGTFSDQERGDNTQGMDPGPGPTLRGGGAG